MDNTKNKKVIVNYLHGFGLVHRMSIEMNPSLRQNYCEITKKFQQKKIFPYSFQAYDA